jgi:hypothetical protein
MAEITHIQCARCGKDNVINNRERDFGTLSVNNISTEKLEIIEIILTCQHCAKSYPITSTSKTKTDIPAENQLNNN